MIINWLLTRKCNIRCHYCGIVRDPAPEEYTSISEYYQNEMSSSEVIQGINHIHDKFGDDVFHIFYGGEPFLFKGLEDILNYCNDNDIFYTVITNGLLIDKIMEVKDKLKNKTFRGLSTSLDPIFFEDDDMSDTRKKTNNALQLLEINKKENFVSDMVVETTVDKNNIKYLQRMLKTMNKKYPDTKVSVTAYDRPWSEYYDFSYISKNKLSDYESYIITKDNKKAKNVFTNILKNRNKYPNIHMINTKLIDTLWNNIDSTYKCGIDKIEKNNIKTLTIDSDGSIRLCLRIKGVYAPKFKLLDLLSYQGPLFFDEIWSHFISFYKEDYKKLCQGCNWTCPMMQQCSEDFKKDVGHE